MNRNETEGQLVTIPEASHLEKQFQEIETGDHATAIALSKQIRQDEFKKIEDWLITNVNEVSGWDVSVRLTSITDGIVRALARRIFKSEAVSESVWQHIGLFAIGGYGRGELNPHSDLDVMLVYLDNKMPAWLQQMYNDFHTLLWDAGFKVGIALRGISELDYLLKDDFVTATALLEYRLLLGTGSSEQAMSDLLDRFRQKRSKVFLKYKIEELMERRNKAGASLFLMEPNLKTNPGCLRDVQLLYNISYIVFGGRNLYALKELSAVKVEDIRALFQANEHLLRMRSLQHFFHGRRQDELELKDQVRIAQQLGYSGYSRLSAVEVMMREHYHMVMRVHKMVELMISHLKMQGHLGKRISLLKTRKKINQHFTAIAGHIYCTNRNIWSDPDAPAIIMEMFLTAHNRNLHVSLETQRHIRANLHILQEDTYSRNNPRIAKAFMAILGNIGRIQITLEEMHNCGFLDAYMPEFDNISCLMQFNSYHQYTVDQHTLFAVGNIDRVHRGKDKGLPQMPQIFQRIKRKDLLVLGLLLHDVGKYMGRGHVMRGALMVGPVAARLQLDQEEEDIVYFLVEQHVSLSDASRMRDISEPAFVESFAETMGSQERLDMLYCLTYADAKATSDKALTGWQMSVLYDLYRNLSDYLANDTMTARKGKRARVVNALLERGCDEAAIDDYLNGLPGQYAFQVSPDVACTHYELTQIAKEGKIGFRNFLSDDSAGIDIALPWGPGRFADTAGVLSSVGCQIIDARIWTMSRSVIIFRFLVEHSLPQKFEDTSWWGRLVKHLQTIVDGTCNLDALLEQREHNMAFEDKAADSGFNDPAVKVEQQTSPKYSIFDVHYKDRPGSLSTIARVISDFGAVTDYASTGTQGDVTTAVFYVNKDEKKLTTEDAQSLRHTIADALDVMEV